MEGHRQRRRRRTSHASLNRPAPARAENTPFRLGRNLSTGPNGTVIVNLIPSGTLYGERLNQIDTRFAKNFTLGRSRIQAQVDLYNLLNDNPVMSLNTRYGTAWQQPVSILPGRLFKVGAQWNF